MATHPNLGASETIRWLGSALTFPELVNEPHYYNEIDPDMADWLRVLMSEGFIPMGDVDERSIVDVRPTDLRGYVQCHFFAGLGGWPLALRFAGVSPARRLWTGSCPCQPFSCAGKRRGTSDARHLWPVWVRLIAECNGLYGVPTVFGEQVASALGREWLTGVRASLENLAYVFGGADLCSASVRAPNIRQRLFWAAKSTSKQTIASNEGRLHSEFISGGTSSGLAKSSAPGNGRRRIQRPGESNGSVAQRPSEKFTGCGADCGWMGEPIQPGLEGHAWNGDNGSEPGRNGETAARPTPAASDFGGLEQSARDGREQRRTEPGGRGVTERCGESGVDDPGCSTDERRSGLRSPHSSNEAFEIEAQQRQRGRDANRDSVPDGRLAEHDGRQSSNGELQSVGQQRFSAPSGIDNGPTIVTERQEDFWAEYLWHYCRDKKYRRIPVEPSFFPLAARLPGRVAMLKGFGNAINPRIAAAFIQATDLDPETISEL